MVHIQYAKILPFRSEELWSILCDAPLWQTWNATIESTKAQAQLFNGQTFLLRFRSGLVKRLFVTVQLLQEGVGFLLRGASPGIQTVITIKLFPQQLQTRVQIDLEYTGLLAWMNSFFGPPKASEDFAIRWIESLEKYSAQLYGHH
ncbi:MAG: hypothetical protein V1778_01415 [bacterium]